MSASNTYLAVFVGNKNSPKRAAWDAQSADDRRAKEMAGIAAWKGWVEKHQAVLVNVGGPLGKTKKVSQRGIEDISNVRADSHEAAARLFENHPHFAIFPGEAVEVMPVMPIPGG
jgi:hypothetical protein